MCGRCVVNNATCGDPFNAGITRAWAAQPEVAECHACESGLASCGFQPVDGALAQACTAFRSCDPGQYVAAPGTATSDRVCQSCPPDTWQPETVTFGPVLLDAQIAGCAALQSCSPGEYYVTTTGNATDDRVCAACPPGTFLSDDDHLLVECTNMTDCAADGRGTVTVSTDATRDSVCENCSYPFFFNASGEVCSLCSACDPLLEVQLAECSTTSDTQCRERVACNPSTTYTATPPTPTTDSVCLPCSTCWFDARDVVFLVGGSVSEVEHSHRLRWVDIFLATVFSSSHQSDAVK